MKNSKKNYILMSTNGGEDVFRYYLPEYDGTRKAFLSPLRNEGNPSASIFKAASGQYLLKDFGTGQVLNCFDFVMNKFGISNFNEAVNTIVNNLNLKK